MMPLARPVARCETLVELTSLILHVTLYIQLSFGGLYAGRKSLIQLCLMIVLLTWIHYYAWEGRMFSKVWKLEIWLK